MASISNVHAATLDPTLTVTILFGEILGPYLQAAVLHDLLYKLLAINLPIQPLRQAHHVESSLARRSDRMRPEAGESIANQDNLIAHVQVLRADHIRNTLHEGIRCLVSLMKEVRLIPRRSNTLAYHLGHLWWQSVICFRFEHLPSVPGDHPCAKVHERQRSHVRSLTYQEEW